MRVEELFEVYREGELLVRMELSLLCERDEFLSPVSIVGTGEEGARFSVERDGDAFTGSGSRPGRPPRDVNLAVSPRTVATSNLFLIVEGRPFAAEDVFAHDSLEAEELNFKPDHTLTYAGVKEVDGATLHEFVEEGQGISPFRLYVDDDHRVQRAVMDGRKVFDRVSAEEGEALLEKLRSQVEAGGK